MATRTLNKHDRQHLLAIQEYEREVERIYIEAMDRVSNLVLLFAPGELNEDFALEDYPVLFVGVQGILDRLRLDIEGSIRAASALEWERGLTKNLDLAIMAYGPTVYPLVERTLAADNRTGLLRFLSRKTGPPRQKLTLSERVWRLRNGLQREIESELFANIQEGAQPAEMARNMKKFLKEPDRAYRRVRDAEGVLRLSKSARSYKLGRGVYRSSLQNALRLTRHESHVAMRVSEAQKWKAAPFVLGYEVMRSGASRGKCDLCDPLQGTYPTSFVFSSWHPFCLCVAFPILASEREFKAYEQALLSGRRHSFEGRVTDLPESFKDWYLKNQPYLAERKSTLFFVSENLRLVSSLLSK